MQEINFEHICDNLTKRLQAKKSIEEEQVSVFLDSVTEKLTALEEPKEKASGYQALSDLVNKMWHYGDFGKATRLQVFLYGSIWAGIRMIERKRKNASRKTKLEELISYYTDKEWLLKIICDNPGIRHKDLAKLGGKSVSQLSQMVSRASKDELISYHRLGREKYYFLMDSGETVYKEIAERRKRLYHYNTELSDYELLALRGRNLNSQDAAYLSDRIMDYISNRDGSINIEISALLKKEQKGNHWGLQDTPKALEQNNYNNIWMIQNNHDSQITGWYAENREPVYEEV